MQAVTKVPGAAVLVEPAQFTTAAGWCRLLWCSTSGVRLAGPVLQQVRILIFAVGGAVAEGTECTAAATVHVPTTAPCSPPIPEIDCGHTCSIN